MNKIAFDMFIAGLGCALIGFGAKSASVALGAFFIVMVLKNRTTDQK